MLLGGRRMLQPNQPLYWQRQRMAGTRATEQRLEKGRRLGMAAGNKSVNDCTMAGANKCGYRMTQQARSNRQHDNHPSSGASKAGRGWQPQPQAMTRGEDNEDNKEEGSSMSDKESSGDVTNDVLLLRD